MVQKKRYICKVLFSPHNSCFPLTFWRPFTFIWHLSSQSILENHFYWTTFDHENLAWNSLTNSCTYSSKHTNSVSHFHPLSLKIGILESDFLSSNSSREHLIWGLEFCFLTCEMETITVPTLWGCCGNEVSYFKWDNYSSTGHGTVHSVNASHYFISKINCTESEFSSS